MTNAVDCLNPPWVTTWKQWPHRKQRGGGSLITDAYLAGAAVQYSYSWSVLLQEGGLQQEGKEEGECGHSRQGREQLVKCSLAPRKDKDAFSFIHAIHSLFYSFYLINIYPEATKCWHCSPC